MSNTGPIESYLKYNHSWKNDKMENSNISSNNSYSQNINEYKKIFDLSALNSENEAQYYGSGDQLNHPTDYSSNKKSKYYSPKKNNNEEWNKNISRTINKINQILDNDEPNSIYLDPNPIKRYNDNGDFEFNDPFMDHNNKIQINTTENKRENNKDPLRRRKSHSKKKSRKNSTKDPKKRDDLGTKSSSQKRKGSHSASSPKKKEKEKRKLSNNDEDILKNKNSNDTTNNKSLKSTESKYDADISLNSSLNSSDTSINKIIQKNLSEYSRDISDLINKDLENKLKNENNKKQESTKKHYDPVKKDEAHSKPLMNKNNKDNNDKNLSNQNVDNKNNVVKNKNNSELNNKIDYIDKLINEFKEKDDQQKEYDISPSFNMNKFKSENVPIDNNKVKSSNEEISIEIKCPFYSNGCNWCNKQSKLSDHLLYECTFCPNIITNAFGKNNENKKKSIEDLNKKLSKLTIDNLKDDDKVELKKDIRSSEFDRDVLSVIFNNYLNEDDKPEKEKSIPDKQDGLFDQIIQNYKYTNDNNESHLFKGNNNNNNKTKDSNSNNIFNLTLDTNLFYNKEDLISTADINFNNEPLTWDINSEKDNTVPWSTTPISPSKKERKKYRLSDNNDKVSVKNKKSPDKEIYAQKKIT